MHGASGRARRVRRRLENHALGIRGGLATVRPNTLQRLAIAGLTWGLLVAFCLDLPAADTSDEAALGLVVLWVEFNVSLEDITARASALGCFECLCSPRFPSPSTHHIIIHPSQDQEKFHRSLAHLRAYRLPHMWHAYCGSVSWDLRCLVRCSFRRNAFLQPGTAHSNSIGAVEDSACPSWSRAVLIVQWLAHDGSGSRPFARASAMWDSKPL